MDDALARTRAIVLTHRRPVLAAGLTRQLVEREGFDPAHVTVVVNGEGGLADPQLAARVRVVRLEQNTGPAGGFAAGMAAAFSEPAVEWAYLCEDDVGLFPLPWPRVRRILSGLALRPDRAEIGAVVAYGRRFAGNRGHTENVVPPQQAHPGFSGVDVAAWGATLVARAVVEAGVLPDPRLFFGYEDFDFFLRMRKAGFRLLLDDLSARLVAEEQTSAGRDHAILGHRPADVEEPWRAYYVARNFVTLAHRHGSKRWLWWHLLYSARRVQLAGSNAERGAILVGLLDGARGRLGPRPLPRPSRSHRLP